MLINSSRHIFAFFFADASAFVSSRVGNEIALDDKDLIRRLACIIRAQAGDIVVLFNRVHHVELEICSIGKKEVVFRMLAVKKNTSLTPHIHWYVPLLERDALEEALASLTVLGATTVQLMLTRKVHRKDYTPHEQNRVQRSMIAAAEQSKQFVFPEILSPVSFESCIDGLGKCPDSLRLFFDHDGLSSYEMIQKLTIHASEKTTHDDLVRDIVCIAGPEGDLDEREKEVLRASGFVFYKLTPTILRSQHAIALATGIIRSIL